MLLLPLLPIKILAKFPLSPFSHFTHCSWGTRQLSNVAKLVHTAVPLVQEESVFFLVFKCCHFRSLCVLFVLFYVVSVWFSKVCQRQLDHNLPLFKYLRGPSQRLIKYQTLLKVKSIRWCFFCVGKTDACAMLLFFLRHVDLWLCLPNVKMSILGAFSALWV